MENSGKIKQNTVTTNFQHSEVSEQGEGVDSKNGCHLGRP